MELLAPAGTLEAAIAALQYGADAIYLGLQDFSARADAGNFTPEELRTLLGLAHDDPRGPRKVYVTVNTLLREDEQPRLLELLQELSELHVDALIIQDWGVLQLVREHFPHFELHASTQLAIHDTHGAEAARRLGLSRVVLARELTIPEIARISDLPGIQTEVFIHGALCYAYSGLCCLSAALRGPSGNRGSCAYVCRGCFNVRNGERRCGNANLMSMKDLATPDLLPQLRRAHVASLKIEGRKKTPLYVAATVNFYRHLLDGTQPEGGLAAAEADVKTIFSRPWTPFHLRSRKQSAVTDIHTVGHRGTEAGIITDVIHDLPDRLRFTIRNAPLEKHDGLQVELPGRDRPFGFPVNDIRVFPQRNNDTWENAFVAQPGTTVEVSLPDEHPDLPVGARLFRTSSQAVKRAYDWEMPRPALCKERLPVAFRVTLTPTRLDATAHLTTPGQQQLRAETTQDLATPLSPARQPERADEAVRNAFAKLGDTDFSAERIDVDNPDHLFVPASQLNLLRRQLTDDLADELVRQRQRRLDDLTAHLQPAHAARKPPIQQPRWTLLTDRAFRLNLLQDSDYSRVDELVFSLAATPEAELADELAAMDAIVAAHPHLTLRLALPPIIREGAGHVTPHAIEALVKAGRHRWQAANIGHLDLLRQAGAPLNPGDVTADWTLFVTNTAAAQALLKQGYARLTLAPDDAWDNWLALLQSPHAPLLDVPVFSDFPLAISDVCAMASLQGACPGPAACTFTQLNLDNVRTKGERLLAVNNRCQTIILNHRPLNLTGHIRELVTNGATHLRADFCWRNDAPTTVRDLWRQLQQDTPDPNAWTANLFRDAFLDTTADS